MKRRRFQGFISVIAAVSILSLCSGCGGGSGAPAAPTGLTVTISDNAGELVISWTASSGATSYNLYWGNSAGVTPTTGTQIANVTSPYTHTGLTDGTRYYYVATAVSGGGESAASAEANGLPQIDPTGVLDTDLAGIGYVRYLTDDGYAMGVEVDSSGRIVISGSIIIGADTYMALWRYNADGSADTTFGGGDGLVTVTGTAGGTMDEGSDVAIDASGRILVAGYSRNAVPRSEIVVWRFTSDGTADASFGSGGFVRYDRGLGDNWAESILLDASGRILVAGISENAGAVRNMALLRYTDAGVLDTTLGGTGVVIRQDTSGAGSLDAAWGVAVNSSGGIAVVGETGIATNDLVIWRFTDAGALDTSFGGDGIVLFDRGGDDDGRDVTFDNQGRVVATGSSSAGAVTDLLVLRYTAAGDLDTTFSDDGVFVYHTGNGDAGNSIAMDSRQRPVVTGHSGLAGFDTDMVLMRLEDDGTYDTSFGTGGVVLFNIADQDFGNAIAFDATGRIVIAGTGDSAGGVSTMIFWRYE